MKKHTREDDEHMEDTVEKKVEGMAEAVIEEDQQRRAQDLVSVPGRICGQCV